MKSWAYHYEVKAPRTSISERFAAFEGKAKFDLDGHTVCSWWGENRALCLTITGACADHEEPRPETMQGRLAKAISLFLQAEVQLEYQNHEVNGRRQVQSGNHFYYSTRGPRSAFDTRQMPANYAEAVRGLESDRDLLNAYNYYMLGIRAYHINGPVGTALTLPICLSQFGMTIEAVGYRLAMTDGFDQALGAISKHFKTRLSPLGAERKKLIRDARNQGAHYYLPGGRPSNMPEVVEMVREFARDVLIVAGIDCARQTLPPAPPPPT